jgi:geranylgeranyl transferase type-1 subunit beta
MSYCAAIARAVLRANGKRSIASEDVFDVAAARGFVSRCKTWDGGYAARPGLEAQGGTTYCCTAALALLGAEQELAETTRWLTQRQIGGFQGRPGKLEDVCYSFWCGGALAVSDLLHSWMIQILWF